MDDDSEALLLWKLNKVLPTGITCLELKRRVVAYMVDVQLSQQDGLKFAKKLSKTDTISLEDRFRSPYDRPTLDTIMETFENDAVNEPLNIVNVALRKSELNGRTISKNKLNEKIELLIKEKDVMNSKSEIIKKKDSIFENIASHGTSKSRYIAHFLLDYSKVTSIYHDIPSNSEQRLWRILNSWDRKEANTEMKWKYLVLILNFLNKGTLKTYLVADENRKMNECAQNKNVLEEDTIGLDGNQISYALAKVTVDGKRTTDIPASLDGVTKCDEPDGTSVDGNQTNVSGPTVSDLTERDVFNLHELLITQQNLPHWKLLLLTLDEKGFVKISDETFKGLEDPGCIAMGDLLLEHITILDDRITCEEFLKKLNHECHESHIRNDIVRLLTPSKQVKVKDLDTETKLKLAVKCVLNVPGVMTWEQIAEQFKLSASAKTAIKNKGAEARINSTKISDVFLVLRTKNTTLKLQTIEDVLREKHINSVANTLRDIIKSKTE